MGARGQPSGTPVRILERITNRDVHPVVINSRSQDFVVYAEPGDYAELLGMDRDLVTTYCLLINGREIWVQGRGFFEPMGLLDLIARADEPGAQRV